jgi:pimeloyl-ACP methyl ester carboxylesterase
MKSGVLVLLHGYPFDHTMWYSVIASLGSGTKVLAPDLPGFGRASVSSAKPSLDVMADAVADYLDRAEAGKAVVAGMSMGGYVALAFAEKYPNRLAGLGLINTQTQADTEEVRKGRRALIERIKTDGVTPAVQAILPKLFSAARSKDPDLIAFPTEGAAKAGQAGLSWALEAMASRPDRTKILTKISAPVLILHGSEDQIIPIARARSMADAKPHSNFIEIRGCGHCSPIEAPDIVATKLKAFAESAFSPPAEA